MTKKIKQGAHYSADGWTIELGHYEAVVGRHSLDDRALRADLSIREWSPEGRAG